MTRTYPPDIIESTFYQDFTFGPNCGLAKYSLSTKECDSQMVGTQNQNFGTINKRHCRSFDFIESFDEPDNFSSSMEYPYTTGRQTVKKDVMCNGIGQQGHLRFSSPDLFNTKLSQQQISIEKNSESIKASVQRKTWSKCPPKVRDTITPVPITVLQPSARMVRSPVHHQKRPDGLPQNRESSLNTNRALVNEVHPIKLQPHKPLSVSDCFEESRHDKLANSPHVRYRVDIKPDAAVLRQTARRLPTARSDIPCQYYSTSGFRSMSVPRQMPTSRTPTPSECYSMDFSQAYHYPNCIPSGLIPPAGVSLDSTSPRNPREYRTQSHPNIPTKFFYTEHPTKYPAHPLFRAYSPDDLYSINSSNSQNPSLSSQYVSDPRSRWVHTMPMRMNYTDSRRESLNVYYNRPYSVSEPGSYFMSTPQTRTYYRESSLPSDHSKVFYTQSCDSPTEYPIPLRAYQTEGQHISQVLSEDYYGSSIASNFSQYPSPHMSHWYDTHFSEPSQLGDVRNYSKSWDNIHVSQTENQNTIPRGRSYENLNHQGRERISPNNRKKTVIINLSSSPRRYAALSLSENSLEKHPTDRSTGMECHWFVTPEITITDNDLCANNCRTRNRASGGWNVKNDRWPQNANTQSIIRQTDTLEPSESKHNDSFLQQSLEQLDKLLADLVTDYKPQNSRQSKEGLIDQLKHLINEDGVKGEKVLDQEDSGLLNTQTNSSKTSPDTFKDPDSGCEGFHMSAEEISINQSVDENDSMVCSYCKCQRRETLFNASLYFKSCHSCYTYYCSRNCRRDDWDTHKETCLHGRISSICRHILKHCRENSEIHKAFSRIAKVGYLSRGRGVLFIGFQNPGSAVTFLQVGLSSIVMSPTYLSLRELGSFKDNLGEYCKELQDAGKEYDPSECFLLNVSIGIDNLVPNKPSPRSQSATIRKYAKVSLASSSPEKKVLKKENDMETLILTPPPGTSDIDKEGLEGRKAREICFINIQKELRTRGVFLRHEFPKIYKQLCEFVENNKRFTPTTIYPIDKRTGKQFMCMIMAASEPRTLDWIDAPHLLDDII